MTIEFVTDNCLYPLFSTKSLLMYYLVQRMTHGCFLLIIVMTRSLRVFINQFEWYGQRYNPPNSIHTPKDYIGRNIPSRPFTIRNLENFIPDSTPSNFSSTLRILFSLSCLFLFYNH